MSAGTKRILPALLTAMSLAALAALLIGGRLAEIAFGLLATQLPVALAALATTRHKRLRPALAALSLLLGSSALLLLLRSPGEEAEIVLGLPLTAWVAFIGLGLLPFVLVVGSYTATWRDDPVRGRGD